MSRSHEGDDQASSPDDDDPKLRRARRRILRDYRKYARERTRLASLAGVPSWRERWNAGAYKELTPWQQAWGFLRHYSVYRLSWPPRGDSEDEEWAKRFGLVHLINPGTTPFDLEADPFIPIPKAAAKDNVREGPVELRLTHGQAAIVLDLREPVAPQIAAAKRRLTMQKWRTTRRLHRDKLPYYLAALDAHEAGADLAEIGAVLYPRHPGNAAEQAKNDLRAANKLVRLRYWSVSG